MRKSRSKPALPASRHLPPALRHRRFALLLVALLASTGANQMIAVAIGWQVFALERNPLHLGLVGLVEFLPLLLLALPAGHLADRFSRTVLFALSLVIEVAVAALLLLLTASGSQSLWAFLALAAGIGTAAALGSPAARALPAALVPANLLAGAMALRGVAGQTAAVSGPAVGGFLFAASPKAVYATAAGLFAVALACVVPLREGDTAAARRALSAETLEGLLGGLRFLFRAPVVLGAITLDLFAVLFGGAVALLPVYASEILNVGPSGLGILRSAPAVGALVAGLILARRPLGGRTGRTLLIAVAVFGASLVVFGLSRAFLLSLTALFVSGFADMISMNIRATTVVLGTPDRLRGRVNAVEMVFIGASNELGAFESGAAAALVGTVPAVVGGGALTLALAATWRWFFPALSTLDRMEDLAADKA